MKRFWIKGLGALALFVGSAAEVVIIISFASLYNITLIDYLCFIAASVVPNVFILVGYVTMRYEV